MIVAAPRSAPGVPGPATAPAQAPGIHLLHIEDNSADALLAQELLREVLPDATFDPAVRLSEITPERVANVDCVLLDLSLPDASGLEALIALRVMSERLPIVVLTGFDTLDRGMAAVRQGADDYLIKNHINPQALERSIRYAIERRQLIFEPMSSSDGRPGEATSLVPRLETVRDAPKPQSISNDAVMFERFVSLGHVAEVLGISPSQTYALVRSGDLRAIKIGGRGQWRVGSSVLNAYIERMYAETRAFVDSHPYATGYK